MKIYKDQNNNLWAYEEDGSQDHLIPVDFVAINNKEAEALRPVYVPTYAEKRAAEYPPMTEYLDGLVKGNQAQIDKYIADCLAVKAKYPKVTQ